MMQLIYSVKHNSRGSLDVKTIICDSDINITEILEQQLTHLMKYNSRMTWPSLQEKIYRH